MIDDDVILTVERLRDELADLKTSLRTRYRSADRQVTNGDLKARGARAAETWMVDVSGRDDVRRRIASDYLANLNVNFQRLLTASEHASKRLKYDSAIQAILKRFTLDVVVPLKQAHSRALSPVASVMPGSSGSDHIEIRPECPAFVRTAFVGHSFAATDIPVAQSIIQVLTGLGFAVVTGEKPKADRISEKIKRLIDDQHIFVGIFTRREKIARKKEWTTTPWVIDEKAYAVGKSKKLILMKEEGVGSIGGIQGDYEFIEFSRDRLEDLVLKVIQLFVIEVSAFHI